MAGDIVEFERAVWARDNVAALRFLHRLLRAIAGGKPPRPEDSPPARDPASERIRLANRSCAAIAALFADPGFVIDAESFIRFVPFGRTLANIFAVSAYGSSDPVLAAMMPAVAPREAVLPDGPARLKYLLLWSLDSRRDHPIEDLFAIEPALRLPLFVKLLETKPVATARAHQRREALLENFESLGLGGIPRGDQEGLVALANAWMLCSYADGVGKHRVKAHFNQALRHWLLRNGMSDAAETRPRRLTSRPTIVVAAEVMQSPHVQYRYFGQWLRQLRESFRLVLVTEKREIDAANAALFDEAHGFERRNDGSHLRDAARLITQASPDLLFYPSVGMRHWGVALANLRLAPIQATALGHSASSFAPTIDYYVVEEGYVGDPALFTETIALLPDESLRFERQPGVERLEPRIRESAPVLRIAVPSNALKLNVHFLETLARIAKRASRRLEFHFFPNVGGFEGDAVRAAVHALLPSAVVWPVLDYANYLARLNACDLTLSPFPFGGLHSVVDSLRQGVPVVALCGSEPHARTDALMLKLAGMPSWLTANRVDAYVDTALRVIDDDALRVTLSRQAIACDVAETLFGDGETPPRMEVRRLFEWLIENHESVRRSGARMIGPGLRLETSRRAVSA